MLKCWGAGFSFSSWVHVHYLAEQHKNSVVQLFLHRRFIWQIFSWSGVPSSVPLSGGISSGSVTIRRRNKTQFFHWNMNKTIDEKTWKKTLFSTTEDCYRGFSKCLSIVNTILSTVTTIISTVFDRITWTSIAWKSEANPNILYLVFLEFLFVCYGGKCRQFSSKLLLLISFYSWWMRMLQTINLSLVQANCCLSWASSQHNFVGRNYTTWWERSK